MKNNRITAQIKTLCFLFTNYLFYIFSHPITCRKFSIFGGRLFGANRGLLEEKSIFAPFV